jgi:hypothetical protein
MTDTDVAEPLPAPRKPTSAWERAEIQRKREAAMRRGHEAISAWICPVCSHRGWLSSRLEPMASATCSKCASTALVADVMERWP